MLNPRHNNDKHNGPGLSGSIVPQLTRLFSPPLLLLPAHCAQCCTVSFCQQVARCNCAAWGCCCLLVCCAFVSCTTRTWNMRLVCLLATQLRQQQWLPRGCNSNNSSRGSRWRVDFISINALLSSSSFPLAPSTRCASVAHGKVNALMRLSF